MKGDLAGGVNTPVGAGSGCPPGIPTPRGDVAIPIDTSVVLSPATAAEEVAYMRIITSAGAAGTVLTGGAVVLLVNSPTEDLDVPFICITLCLVFEYITFLLGVGLLCLHISDIPMNPPVEIKARKVMYIGLWFLVGSVVSLGSTSLPLPHLGIVWLAVLSALGLIAILLSPGRKKADSKVPDAGLPL
ncbi:unnamed protein product [Spirodela intermedia]|uniref:Uncharacterized protein n=1 Tax=Spirodela intermedia TaxID=51605 RepID=A0A7I8KHU5_SPIIN|nr:unnamed protein product [Spirodela intermedia]